MMLSRNTIKSRFSTFQKLSLLTTALVLSGCGSSETTTASTKPAASPTNQATATATDVSAAGITVAQFLDAVRRGGETGGANQLLTQQAQTVLKQLGQTVQPIGSPDAIFQVTRAESVPDTPGAALVHSLWTEPAMEGKSESYEVVWALMNEPTGWRISGLAMDLEPGQDPMIVDFENVGQMANLFNQSTTNAVATATATGAGNPAGGDAVSQAPPDPTAIQR